MRAATLSFLLAAALTTMAAARAAHADPTPADPCAETYECRRHGWCSTEGSKCVARSAEHCAASTTCRESGLRCHFDANAGLCVSALARPRPTPPPRGTMRPSGRMPPGSYDPEIYQQHTARDAGILLTVLGGLGCLTGAVAGGLWELTPEGDTQDTLMIVSLSAGIPGAAMTSAGVMIAKVQGDTPIFASVGPGTLRVTF